MMLRRELPGDAAAIRAVHADAFAAAGSADPAESALVDALRADPGWIPGLSVVALDGGEIAGHVVATRGHVDGHPALGLGPLGVRRAAQGGGIGTALVHAVLAAADVLDEPLVALVGHRDYYPRFGFEPAHRYGIRPPEPDWAENFQVRPLTAHRPEITGTFRYAAPFGEL